nr:hypothetical protein [uncultured Psychroserpens sp.]
MTVFESLNETTNKATETAEKYAQTSKEYFKLKVFQQLALSLSLVTKACIIGGLIVLALIFISVSAAIAIGHELENLAMGYLIVGVIYLILSIIVYLIRGKIDIKVITSVSDKFFDQ